jgi:hypothetical protein
MGLLLFLGYQFEHAKRMSFVLSWAPGDSYAPARIFRSTSPNGEPKVVLVRRTKNLECFEVHYSQALENTLKKIPSHEITATYEVRFRFGRSYWISDVDLGGFGNQPITQYDVSGQQGQGDCFRP